MTDKPDKIRCSICGSSVVIKDRCVAEHANPVISSIIRCYGSYMPVFRIKNGWIIGNIMYIRKSREDDPFLDA